MEDLLDNFADQSIKSSTEEGYKYHFLDGSPAGSEHERPVHPATAASAGPSNDNPFFDIKAPGSHQAIGNEDEDEGNYNADVDEDDDEDGRDEASRYEVHEHPTSAANYRNLEPSLAPSDDEEDGSDGFAQQLRRLHSQDMERDELLMQLHQTNLDLNRALKESVPGGNLPGGNPRAEAAERNMFEIGRALDKSLYVFVLIDGKGYKVHEDLLQFGKRGGAEAADRLRTEVSNYLQQFGDAKSWEIMVHLYIDIEGLLARCISNDILLSDENVRDFMLGFTQAQPLFVIVDVGHDSEKLLQKVKGMFHLFVKNVQCKHLIFGCCHNVAYAVALEPYGFDPITAARITLLKSYEDKTCFEGLPFNSVEFPHVFRSTPFKETDRLAEDDEYMQDLPLQSGSDRITREVENSSANEVARRDEDRIMREVEKSKADEVQGGDEALAKWQAAANASVPLPTRARPQAEVHSGWATEKNILLNIDDERVDRELEEVNYETSESMLDRMEEQRFCAFYHLQNSCLAISLGKPCHFRHGARLNDDELRFLKKDFRRIPCNFGSRCRKPDCNYGHVCANQPGCERGPKCPLFRFHEVDKTAVKVWSPEKSLSSPRKR